MKTRTYILLALIVLVLFYFARNYYYSQFNSQRWKEDNHRDLMVDDIIDNCLFLGKSKQEIKELLGKDCFKCSFENDNMIIYWTDFFDAPHGGIIIYDITISFNNNQKVNKIEYFKDNKLIKECK